jgi:hypothetical protein
LKQKAATAREILMCDRCNSVFVPARATSTEIYVDFYVEIIVLFERFEQWFPGSKVWTSVVPWLVRPQAPYDAMHI